MAVPIGNINIQDFFTSRADDFSSFAAGSFVIYFVCLSVLAAAVFGIIIYWKLFEKFGEPGWKSLIPIYNGVILCRYTFGHGWYFLLFLIPGLNLVLSIIQMVKLARAFNEDTAFAIGLIFLQVIFMAILAFSSRTYDYNRIAE